MQNEVYKNTFGISQSAIKDFVYKDINNWKRIWIDNEKDLSKNEETFILGTIVDMLMFSGVDEIKKHFFITDKIETTPSAITKIVTDFYYKMINRRDQLLNAARNLPEKPKFEIDFYRDDDLLLEAINNYKDSDGKAGWQSNWKDATRLASIREKGKYYFTFLQNANGKKILNKHIFESALEFQKLLTQNLVSKNYFVPSEKIELIFQLEIFEHEKFNEYKLPLKGAIDILKIDHGAKTVQIADLKTSFDGKNFVKSIINFGYCDQLSFYSFLLEKWIKNKPFKNYKILPPVNIVMDVKSKLIYLYEYNEFDLNISKTGNAELLFNLFKTKNHPFKIKKGWYEILSEIAWHFENNIFYQCKDLVLYQKIKLNLLNC